MKKISFFAILMALVCMATSCEKETDPKLEKPTEFVLNTPEFANLTYYVPEGGSIQFTCSQANYNLGITPLYQLEVSATEDFADYQVVDYTTTMARMTIPAEPFAMAVCAAYGWQEGPEQVHEVPLYVRCRSTVPNAPESYNITSNVVKLSSVLVYFAVKLPDAIYLIGQPQGWSIDDGSMPLFETEQGSLIYKGTYEIKAGEFQFRFYDELGVWDNFSIGAQDPDEAVTITLVNGEYTGDCYYDPATPKAGKGAWQVPDWEGGELEMTVNLNNKTVVFKKV